MWIYKSPETDHHRFKLPVVEDDDHHDSTSSSSIGNNSDGGCDSDDEGTGTEVQSLFKGSLNNLSDLENALAVRKGISTFYSGKSKSYTSLADAVSVASIQDIVKPEDAYNRKRKNMLAHSVILNKNSYFTSKSGTSKMIGIANMTNNHYSNAGGESSFPGWSRPPLPTHHRILPTNESPPRSPWRSLSLSDLQHAGGGGVASSFTCSLGSKRDEDD